MHTYIKERVKKLVKFCITSFPGQLFVIKASQFAIFVNEKAISIVLLNRNSSGVASSTSKITVTASWLYDNSIQCVSSNQPTKTSIKIS